MTPKFKSSCGFQLSFHEIMFLGVVVLMALMIRLHGINSQGLWHDEIYTYSNLVGFDIYLFPGSDLSSHQPITTASNYKNRLSEDLFFANLWRGILHEGHPPLYYLLSKAWTVATELSPYMLRMFSLITSLITIPLIYIIGKRVGGKKVAIFSALLFATSPFYTYFSVEARNYSLYILLATLSTFYTLLLYEKVNNTKYVWLGWILASSLACFSHYFAVFYCFLLISIFIIPSILRDKNKNKKKHLVLAITPLILFSLWLPIWYLQVTIHNTGHWTDGWAGLVNSLEYSIYTFLELLSGPISTTGNYEHIYLFLLLLVSFFFIIIKNENTKSSIPIKLIILIPIHAVIIISVDKILDHHTISVARYSSGLVIPLTLILAYGMSKLRNTGILLTLIYLILMTHSSLLTSSGEKAPRQMLMEVANYINSHSNENDIVVVTPSGPTLVGIAMYLNPDTLITAIPAEDLPELIKKEERSSNKTIWSVQQRLGLTYESWNDPSTPTPLSLIRFVGVDLAKY